MHVRLLRTVSELTPMTPGVACVGVPLKSQMVWFLSPARTNLLARPRLQRELPVNLVGGNCGLCLLECEKGATRGSGMKQEHCHCEGQGARREIERSS